MIPALVVLALTYGFLNSYKDSPSLTAVVVFSRALNPRPALLITAAAQFVAPPLFGVAVARTIGSSILRPERIDPTVVPAALAGALAWNLATWYLGLPSSSSHALVGGLVGAALSGAGVDALLPAGLLGVLLSLLISPALGLAGGYLAMRILLQASATASPAINSRFRRLQIPALIALGLSHGANDPPKTMGVIALGLAASGAIPTILVPPWVMILSTGVFCLGTALAGWRVMRTLGGRIYRIRPVHGLATLLGGGSVILASGILGAPVSATHVMSSTVLGVGAADRPNRVRWGVTRGIFLAWVFTLPASAVLGALSQFLLRRLTG